MPQALEKQERQALESTLQWDGVNFTGAYLALRSLHEMVECRPELAETDTLSSLATILNNTKFSAETQAFFLYREAAQVLVTVLEGHAPRGLGKQAFSTLTHALTTTDGPRHRAATEALGSLPLAIQGPNRWENKATPVNTRWEDILRCACWENPGKPVLAGRNILWPDQEKDHVLVIKLDWKEDASRRLFTEACWMDYLGRKQETGPWRFDVPTPLKIDDNYLFSMTNLHTLMAETREFPSKTQAMGYIASKGYFTYPNEHRPGRQQLHKKQFKEVIVRNAALLGRLASHGIVHTAPIPLFHNRVQRDRRTDGGLYEWQRGGRLDRWLHSCRFPNFGVTGVRDFEHFLSFNGPSSQLYTHIGSHLISLFLTAGSYFRNKDVSRTGWDENGAPVDTRDLFDGPFFESILEEVFGAYYLGFTGQPFNGASPCDYAALTDRLIEEMGVDRHMEEILRAADQEEMSGEAFRSFLIERGFSPQEAGCFRKGEQDISILTGPHLGGFNERISTPELIEAVGAMSAVSISGKYWQDHNTSVTAALQ